MAGTIHDHARVIMWTTALAFGSALSWGAADFIGGLKTRTLAVASVTVTSQFAGAALAGATLVVLSPPLPPERTLLCGALAGCANAIGLTAFYRGLAIGRMSVVAPIAGLGVLVPVTVGLVRGEQPGTVQGAGILIAVVGVTLSTRQRDSSRTESTGLSVALAIVAGMGIGGNLALLAPAVHDAPPSAVLWAVLCSRLTVVGALMLMAGLTMPHVPRPPARYLPSLMLLGATDLLANISYGLAVRNSLLSLAAVLASLHPAVTVVLARAMLSESMRRVQQVGVGLAIMGACLLSAG